MMPVREVRRRPVARRSVASRRLALLEYPEAAQAEALEPELADDAERAEAVLDAAAEVDAARLVEVAHRHRDVAEAEAQVDRLDQELGVEDEVVGVALERHALQDLAAVDAE